MHLKSYPKFMRSELRLDVVGVHTSQQRGACSSNHGNVSGSRLPFSVLSTNTLHCSNAINNHVSSCVTVSCEKYTFRVHHTTMEDADPLDIWTVIKPGHVREKIAIFASDGDRTNGAADSERSPTCGSQDGTPPMCTSNLAMAGLLRAMKANGSWDENSSAKRHRRSGSDQNLWQDHRTNKPSLLHLDLSQQSGDGQLPAEEEEQRKVSVVEMVAFLERRVNERRPDSKPLLALQRSSTTITLSRAPPTEVRGEEPDSVRVSDMVAKLESECLRRRTEGDLSRSNSLRRTAGRVLLATGDQGSAPCQPLSQSPVTSPSSSLPGPQSVGRDPTCSLLTTPPSPHTVEAAVSQEIQTPPPQSEEVEPLPGLLFLSLPPAPPDALSHQDSVTRPPPDSGRAQEAGRRASVSQDFLEMRQRLQQLLEPQPYLAVLPHHLLVKIFLLLPTQSLAAIKCTCHYFKFIIDTYGVQPADSLWVRDPRYRDDPCKQCKKRYGRGDVSLCRWHHKPFCQALPYGPGYWMCCHGAHRDTPGCNVGLHDNRWVPAFHSINVPMYRRSQHVD